MDSFKSVSPGEHMQKLGHKECKPWRDCVSIAPLMIPGEYPSQVSHPPKINKLTKIFTTIGILFVECREDVLELVAFL